MKKIPTISVIVPVFNEERTIPSIIEIVRTWGRAHDVIVIDDGSTDTTRSAIRQFSSSVTLIDLPENTGKGNAVAQGILKATGEIIMFLDGDIVGLTHHDLDTLVDTFLSKKAAMVCANTRMDGSLETDFFNGLTGLRVMNKCDLLPLVPLMTSIGFGLELLLNDALKKKKIVFIRLPHVYILSKFEKQSMPQAVVSYVKEARELVAQTVRTNAKAFTPSARRLLGGVIYYLQKAAETLTSDV